MIPEGALFIGLDSSTQGIKLQVLENRNGELCLSASYRVNYDTDLPKYKTHGGVYRDGTTVTANPLMWIEALELVFQRAAQTDLSKVVAISGSGQQHASVYWRKGALDVLRGLTGDSPLAQQLEHCFSTYNSPVWMDSSTTALCNELQNTLGGSQKVAELTGSRAFERFTLPQIAKFSRKQPNAYEQTERISLVSSFMCSVLIGSYANIDAGDGSGMNLMNLKTKEWVPEGLEFGGSRLQDKLGPVVDSYTFAGNVSASVAKRTGLPTTCQVFHWSGDNPCSLVGLRLKEGQIAVSLGTSDTLFGSTRAPQPNPTEGHIFGNPADPQGYMLLLCYKNGSLAREEQRKKTNAADWTEFNKVLESTPPGNNGNIGMYYLEPEITPSAQAGTYRFDANDRAVDSFASSAIDGRAIIEGQFMSMFIHASRLGVQTTSLLATGGGSQNHAIIQILSDVFGVPVYIGDVPDSAALGAAFRSYHGYVCHANGGQYIPADDVLNDKVTTRFSYKLAASPIEANHKIYAPMIKRYEELERRHVKPL